MRLTLRTLLAYLDDILEPADAEDIGRKIEDSEFASSLVTKIRDTTRRLRLGAPKLEGHGVELDPNTVAEYLDNTLSTLRVPDFEKSCLEADVQLAEVASCHQILTLVLGEPAEVDPQSRQRMYELAVGPGLAAEASDAKSVPRPKSADVLAARGGTSARRPKSEVPGYLRDGRSRRNRVLASASAVALLALLALSAFFAIPPSDELASSGADRPDLSAPATAADQEGSPTRSQPTLSDPAAEASHLPDPQILDASEPDAADVPLDIPMPQPGSPPDVGGTNPAPIDVPLERKEVPTEIETAPQSEAVVPDEPDSVPAASSDVGDSAAAPVSASPGLAEADEPPSQLGRFISHPSEVLIKYDAETGDWRLLPPNEIVNPGDTLLTLPDFSSTLTLGIGVVVQLRGGTRVAMDQVGADGLPGVMVAYGRMVMRTVGRAGAQIYLEAGNRHGMLTFEDPESTVAVEVQPFRVEGSDPEAVPPHVVVDLYVAGGRVQWEDAEGGQAEVLQAPAARRLQAPTRDSGAENATDAATLVLPAWVLDPMPLSFAGLRAANDLGDQLVVDRSIRLSLRELAQHRRNEIRALATRGLTYLDEFGPVVEAFGERPQKVHWDEHVESLRRALARGPEVASQVRGALSKHYPSGGEELYRMLWGYTETQLREGDDAILVDYLDHKDLPFNILAFWNLHRITGKSLRYRPQDNPADRQQSLRRWRQELGAGLIVPRAPADE